MQLEGGADVPESSQRKEPLKPSELLSSSSAFNFENQRSVYRNFMATFQISETLLLYPHIYDAIEVMFKEFIKLTAQHSDFCEYIKVLLTRFLAAQDGALPQKLGELDISELVLIRVVCEMIYQENSPEKLAIGTQLIKVFENHFPSGVQLARVLAHYGKSG